MIHQTLINSNHLEAGVLLQYEQLASAQLVIADMPEIEFQILSSDPIDT